MGGDKARAVRLLCFAQHYVKWPPSRATFSVVMEDYPAPKPPSETKKEKRARLRLEKENKGKVPNPMTGFYSERELKVMGRKSIKWEPGDPGPFDQLDIEPWSLKMLKEYTLATIKKP